MVKSIYPILSQLHEYGGCYTLIISLHRLGTGHVSVPEGLLFTLVGAGFSAASSPQRRYEGGQRLLKQLTQGSKYC